MAKKSNRSRGNSKVDLKPADNTSRAARGYARLRRWVLPSQAAYMRWIAAHGPCAIPTCDNCYWTQMREKDVQRYEPVVRKMISHENDLVNHRVNWLLTVQGFLFTALAFAWEKDDSLFLVPMVSAIGVAVALSSAFLLHEGSRAIVELRAWWDKDCPKSWYRGKLTHRGPGVVGRWSNTWYTRHFLPVQVLPVALCCTWALIIVFYFAWVFPHRV